MFRRHGYRPLGKRSGFGIETFHLNGDFGIVFHGVFQAGLLQGIGAQLLEFFQSIKVRAHRYVNFTGGIGHIAVDTDGVFVRFEDGIHRYRSGYGTRAERAGIKILPRFHRKRQIFGGYFEFFVAAYGLPALKGKALAENGVKSARIAYCNSVLLSNVAGLDAVHYKHGQSVGCSLVQIIVESVGNRLPLSIISSGHGQHSAGNGLLVIAAVFGSCETEEPVSLVCRRSKFVTFVVNKFIYAVGRIGKVALIARNLNGYAAGVGIYVGNSQIVFIIIPSGNQSNGRRRAVYRPGTVKFAVGVGQFDFPAALYVIPAREGSYPFVAFFGNGKGFRIAYGVVNRAAAVNYSVSTVGVKTVATFLA